MARMARVVVPGYPHHVTQRGNRRQTTFFCGEDYKAYILLMAESCQKAGTEVWAYCLMPNHVHMVMLPRSEDGLRAAIGEAHRQYTRRINSRMQWQGHLWQERFHSSPMDEAYLLASVRYVERNPVVAALCEKPEQWPWSSTRAHLSGRDDKLVRVQPMLDRIDQWSRYLATEGKSDELENIRRYSRIGRPMGSDRFTETLEQLMGRQLRPLKPGPKQKVDP